MQALVHTMWLEKSHRMREHVHLQCGIARHWLVTISPAFSSLSMPVTSLCCCISLYLKVLEQSPFFFLTFFFRGIFLLAMVYTLDSGWRFFSFFFARACCCLSCQLVTRTASEVLPHLASDWRLPKSLHCFLPCELSFFCERPPPHRRAFCRWQFSTGCWSHLPLSCMGYGH